METEGNVLETRREHRRRHNQFMEHANLDVSMHHYQKLYDKTIKAGFEHQAFIPLLTDAPSKAFVLKIYGYDRVEAPFEAKCDYLSYVKDEERNLRVTISARSAEAYLDWDPIHQSTNFKALCYRLCQFIRQNYNLCFSEYEILEYYRICNMNKGFFLNTIQNDQSPFLEFVRAKRTKMLKYC